LIKHLPCQHSCILLIEKSSCQSCDNLFKILETKLCLEICNKESKYYDFLRFAANPAKTYLEDTLHDVEERGLVPFILHNKNFTKPSLKQCV
jgi:tyrosine-protein phosphatase YwqE